MSRIVLLEFRGKQGDEEAERFVRRLSEAEKLRESSDIILNVLAPSSVTVAAVVQRPTRSCECDMPKEVPGATRKRRRSQAKSRQAGYFRSDRYGWWIHSICRRPTKPVVRAWVSGMLNGANDILPVILGTGPAVSAHQRWQADTGLLSDAPDPKHSEGGPNAAATSPRRSRRARH